MIKELSGQQLVNTMYVLQLIIYILMIICGYVLCLCVQQLKNTDFSKFKIKPKEPQVIKDIEVDISGYDKRPIIEQLNEAFGQVKTIKGAKRNE